MRQIIVYRYGHRPARDKRITTHVALTARAMGADGIIIDVPDKGIEENIASVNRNFGGNFNVQSGMNVNTFMNTRIENGIIIHLTMYGQPIEEKIEEIRKRVESVDKVYIFVGAEKVPGIAYLKSDFNISVTNQPISEVSALAILLDRLNEGKELSRSTHGRLKISGNERGKDVTFYPDRKDCMDLLLKHSANEWLIEHSIAVNSIAMKICDKVNCNREVVDAGSFLHDIGRTVRNDIWHSFEGYRICKDERIADEICRCVLKHTGAGIEKGEAMELGLPPENYMPETLEEKIVATADNLIHGNERITIQDQLKRYEEKGLHAAAERMRALFQEISQKSGLDLDALEI